MKAWHVALVVALALLGFTVARSQRPAASMSVPEASSVARPSQAAAAAAPRSHSAEQLVVAFRLDPELTRSLYMGERWVSPPVFEFAQPGATFTVRAKLQSVGGDGELVDLSADWSTDRPAMLGITRGNGEATLVVREPGEGTVTVASGAGRRTLHVRATRTEDAMQVAIAQQ